jgi:hypothetical protein
MYIMDIGITAFIMDIELITNTKVMARCIKI